MESISSSGYSKIMLHSRDRKIGFTLIELLVVIAIIAILAVVVVLTLNPAQLLAQSRDANRVSDLSTMNDAINLYNTDQSGAPSYSLGTASTMYISVADPSAVSSTGTNCATMGLPATTTGWNDQCPASSNLRLVNGTGWIPVNFSKISSGAPFGALSVDPTNNTSSLLYYTYLTDGSTYEVTVPLESQKYLQQKLIIPDIDPTRYTVGNNLTLLPAEEGLMGYWSLDEGGNATAFDFSGNADNGTWTGNATGTSGYYSPGLVGSWAGAFDGTSTYINVGTGTSTSVMNGSFTFSEWVNTSRIGTSELIGGRGDGVGSSAGIGYTLGLASGGELWTFYVWGSGGTPYHMQPATSYHVTANAWHMITGTYVSASQTAFLYVDGLLEATATNAIYTPPTITSYPFDIGTDPDASVGSWLGLIDDTRLYSRALSGLEIQALYNAEQ
jgi:prepilin-type N-terminal cleavage/methylation domain-containing protein